MNWRKITIVGALIVVPLFFVIGASGRLNTSAFQLNLGSSNAPPNPFDGARRLFSPSLAPRRMERPYGMAPVAWQAFVRACNSAQIHPDRIGQTVGDHPRSAGYHQRDGILKIGSQKVDYCAAVDIGVPDLDEARRNRFLRALFQQGFAAWYRSGPKWKNAEHIHAIYVFLPMKPQLRGQVHQFLRERREVGRSPRWEIKLRRTRKYRRNSA